MPIELLLPVTIVGSIGLFFGIFLGIASKKLHVYINPKIDQVLEEYCLALTVVHVPTLAAPVLPKLWLMERQIRQVASLAEPKQLMQLQTFWEFLQV